MSVLWSLQSYFVTTLILYILYMLCSLSVSKCFIHHTHTAEPDKSQTHE